MLSFHNDIAVKDKYLARVRAHQKADHLIRGTAWTGSKGCAVGCTLEAYDHALYETELGIPEWLARVEDTLFEGMTEEKSRTWPERFLEAIPVGVNLESVRVPFIVMLLRHTLKSMDACQYDAEEWPQVKAAIEQSKAAVTQMIDAQESGDAERIKAADSVAYSAADSVADSARSAYSADSAADSARSAADSAAYSAADSARSAYSARSAAYSAAYDYYADELIQLLQAA